MSDVNDSLSWLLRNAILRIIQYALSCSSLALLLFIYGCSTPVATVNGKHISAKEFRYMLEHTHGADTLRWLITRELLYEENNKLKLVSDADVDSAFEQFKQQHGGEAQFKLWLKRSNRTEDDIREDIKFDLIMFRLRASKVNPKDLKEFYERNKQRYWQPPIVHLYVVMTRKKDAILKAHDELKAGRSFGLVARRYSDIRFLKATGGDLGSVPNGYHKLPQHIWATFYQLAPDAFNIVRHFTPEVWKLINSSPLKKLIGPVLSGDYWLILKVVERQLGRQPPLSEVQQEVLMQYLSERGPSQQDIEEELWRRAKIDIHWDEYKPLEEIYGKAEWMRTPGTANRTQGGTREKQ